LDDIFLRSLTVQSERPRESNTFHGVAEKELFRLGGVEFGNPINFWEVGLALSQIIIEGLSELKF
jgi:hypothetical protein